jgi:hypothetical protein
MAERGADNLRLRSVYHARGLFLLAATSLEPRLLKSLGTTVLPTYRQLFRRHAQAPLGPQRARRVACAIGFEDELIDEDKAAREELGDEYKPALGRQATRLRYPDIRWRDPHKSVNVNAGLTTMSGAEPLRRKLRSWAERWHLSADWCFDWALEQLRTWPPKVPQDYPLDPMGIVLPVPPRLPSWLPQLQTRELYLHDVQELVDRYCNEVGGLIERPLAKRGPGKKRTGRADRHFDWLAGYQVCGWPQNAIAKAIGIEQAAVNRAIHRLARSIGLELQTERNRNWTIQRIQAALGRAPMT